MFTPAAYFEVLCASLEKRTGGFVDALRRSLHGLGMIVLHDLGLDPLSDDFLAWSVLNWILVEPREQRSLGEPCIAGPLFAERLDRDRPSG